MAKATTMDELLSAEGDSVKQLAQGDAIVGTVLSIRRHEVLVDLGAQGIGLVPRREIGFYRALNIGDEVTLFGGNDINGISIDSVAQSLNTINYEITCMVDKRVPRVYIKNGEKINSKDYVLILSTMEN